jgi:predicted 3-demethylubiquinone-9 3-methyltransferase (glyoxalase superfamily)
MKNKITPCLWFHTQTGNISKVVEYYKNIFAENFRNEDIVSLGSTPSGNTEICNVYIFDVKYNFMSTEIEHNPFNDSVGLVLECKNQEEIDLYWDYFTELGKEVECGWCIDKYGLRWQILPENLEELMSKPNGYATLMNQKKIIIAEY